MKLLLDTHVILWALEDSPYLPSNIREMICDERNEIYVSALSLWEIAIKHKKHPEIMTRSAIEIRNYCQRSGYIFLSLSIDNVSTYQTLDLSSHMDPFDQMLASQALSSNMTLITHDKSLLKYNIPSILLF